MMRKLVCALNTGIADVTDFFRVKKLPFFIMEFVVKLNNELWMDKVEESIPDITVILS